MSILPCPIIIVVVVVVVVVAVVVVICVSEALRRCTRTFLTVLLPKGGLILLRSCAAPTPRDSVQKPPHAKVAVA